MSQPDGDNHSQSISSSGLSFPMPKFQWPSSSKISSSSITSKTESALPFLTVQIPLVPNRFSMVDCSTSLGPINIPPMFQSPIFSGVWKRIDFAVATISSAPRRGPRSIRAGLADGQLSFKRGRRRSYATSLRIQTTASRIALRTALKRQSMGDELNWWFVGTETCRLRTLVENLRKSFRIHSTAVRIASRRRSMVDRMRWWVGGGEICRVWTLVAGFRKWKAREENKASRLRVALIR